MVTHVLDDIAVTDLGARKCQPVVAKETLKAQIRHDGGNDTTTRQTLVLCPAFSDHGHQLVAVDDLAILVDDDHTVRIAIQGDTDIGAHFMHLLLQRFRAGRSAAEIDVGAIRLVADRHDISAKLPKSQRSDLVSRTVGAIDGDAKTMKRHVTRQCAFGLLDIAIDIALDALRPADIGGFGKLGVQIAVEQILDAHLQFVGKLVAIRAEELDAIVLERIMRSGDHHTDIRAQRARQHGNGGRRDRAEQKNVEASSGKTRHHGIFQHVTRKARVLADHDAVAVAAVAEDRAHCNAYPHRQIGRHREDVRMSADTIGTKIAACHVISFVVARSMRCGQNQFSARCRITSDRRMSGYCHRRVAQARKLASKPIISRDRISHR
ncbi:hypothetical protein D3C73_671850 [compost metagenome]